MNSHLDDTLSALADGELSAEEEALARAHVATCERCAADLVVVEAVRTLVRDLPPVDPPVPLSAGGDLPAGEEPAPVVPLAPRRRSRLAGLAAAAAAVVALFLLPAIHQDAGGPQLANLVQVHTTSPVNVDLVSQVAPGALPVSYQR
ncbi:MAG TPA: zf-HC2 domain-containing protein [Acidimicrobiales bacterium]|nr:zf-HC2 domain-containing protein [Acidimicrobiales bacterium]